MGVSVDNDFGVVFKGFSNVWSVIEWQVPAVDHSHLDFLDLPFDFVGKVAAEKPVAVSFHTDNRAAFLQNFENRFINHISGVPNLMKTMAKGRQQGARSVVALVPR